MELVLDLNERSYKIVVKKGVIKDAGKHFNLRRKVLIVTDDLIPSIYGETILNQCLEGYIFAIKHGDENKNFETYVSILNELSNKNFTRSDVVVALGGRMVGDVAFFVASTYLRGIDFYNVPTTLLSQIDSSIGGKTGINFNGYKNQIGTFYQPKMVLIDTNLLSTLNERLFNEGLSEAIKMAATCDEHLFSVIENSKDIHEDIEEVIISSLRIKKKIVEEDEKEAGIRKILNFGHTFGHAIESLSNGSFFHGECVAIGMMFSSFGEAKERIKNVLMKYNLPVRTDFTFTEIKEKLVHDKKTSGNCISFVTVNKIGSSNIKEMNINELEGLYEKYLG